VFFQLFLMGFAYSFFPSYNFFIYRIETFGFALCRTSCPTLYVRRFVLGDSLILLLATMAQPFQCVVSRVVFIIFLLLFTRHSKACAMVPFCAPSITRYALSGENSPTNSTFTHPGCPSGLSEVQTGSYS